MKIQQLVFTAIAAGLPGLAMASGGGDVTQVKYVGDNSAKGVCRAIVEDDAEQLQHQLGMQKREMTYGYQYTLLSNEVAGSFTCNDMELLDFSASVGARDVSSYLATGESKSRPQVSSAND